MGKLFAIGDIHGKVLQFQSVVDQFKIKKKDTLVLLGDYIDRGDGSFETIEFIFKLRTKCNLITLCGNHELMLLWSLEDKEMFKSWLKYGGKETLESYRRNNALCYSDNSLPEIPYEHTEFFKKLLPFWENDDCIFVHAGYNKNGHLDCQQSMWGPLYPITKPKRVLLPPHPSGKKVFVGHTAHQQVTDFGHIAALDTGSGFSDGYLSGVEIKGREIVNIYGELA